jgi:hypothetical protein
MIAIDVEQTGHGCPTQFNFTTEDDRPGYARYRWGHLTIDLGKPSQTQENADWVTVFRRQIGDEFDGIIEWNDVEKCIREIKPEDYDIVNEREKEELRNFKSDPQFRRQQWRAHLDLAQASAKKYIPDSPPLYPDIEKTLDEMEKEYLDKNG